MMDLYANWVTNTSKSTRGLTGDQAVEHNALLGRFYEGPPKPSEKYSSFELARKGMIGLYREPFGNHQDTSLLGRVAIGIPGLPLYSLPELLAFSDEELTSKLEKIGAAQHDIHQVIAAISKLRESQSN